MGDAVTYAIELGVGLACLAIALVAWRRRGAAFVTVAVVLAVAGVAAVVHAMTRLV